MINTNKRGAWKMDVEVSMNVEREYKCELVGMFL